MAVEVYGKLVRTECITEPRVSLEEGYDIAVLAKVCTEGKGEEGRVRMIKR